MNSIPLSEPIRHEGLWKPRWWLGFLWGFAEGSFFFVIPDLILSWASLAGVRCGIKSLGAILAGAIVAGLCMYTWAATQPKISQSAVASVPFVNSQMFDKVQQDYQDHGIYGMLSGPSLGIPYKIYAVLAPPVCNPLIFILISIPARLERLALIWLLFTSLGWIFRFRIRRHQRLTTALFTGFWIVSYAIYWTRK